MSCKGVCFKLKAKKPSFGSDGRYASGQTASLDITWN